MVTLWAGGKPDIQEFGVATEQGEETLIAGYFSEWRGTSGPVSHGANSK